MTSKRKAFLGILLFILVGSTTFCSTKPPGLVIDEYLLAGPPDISTESLGYRFANGNQQEILARTKAYRDFRSQILEYNSKALESFGYSLKGFQEKNSMTSHWLSKIYRGDELIASDITFMRPISVNASKTDFIGLVDLYNGFTYTFTREYFEKRIWPPEKEPYIYVGDKLLSIEMTSAAHQEEIISVYLDNELIYRFPILSGRPTYGEIDGPWSYNSHWALILLDGKRNADGNIDPMTRVIQDGQDLNTKYGYEQSFQFAVLDNRPFYFFQKDGKNNISFKGKDFLQNYDEIPHYNCCSPALLNPGISMNMIWFFARRGNDWYYVEAYVPVK